MIRLNNVSKIFPNGLKALDSIDLLVQKNEFLYLVGPSGSGKSTLLKLLFRAHIPSEGTIYIDNFFLNQITHKQVPYLRRSIGVVFQDFKLLPKRTVFENIAFALQFFHYSRTRIRRQVTQVLSLVGLMEKMSQLPDELSGGEQQRVCIARAIVNNPSILLADEPTGNLDPETSIDIIHLLSKINTLRKTTIIVATHNQVIVDDIRKRVIELKCGKIVRDQQFGTYS
jgi:cell division transport system ATP-binding protein